MCEIFNVRHFWGIYKHWSCGNRKSDLLFDVWLFMYVWELWEHSKGTFPRPFFKQFMIRSRPSKHLLKPEDIFFAVKEDTDYAQTFWNSWKTRQTADVEETAIRSPDLVNIEANVQIVVITLYWLFMIFLVFIPVI